MADWLYSAFVQVLSDSSVKNDEESDAEEQEKKIQVEAADTSLPSASIAEDVSGTLDGPSVGVESVEKASNLLPESGYVAVNFPEILVNSDGQEVEKQVPTVEEAEVDGNDSQGVVSNSDDRATGVAAGQIVEDTFNNTEIQETITVDPEELLGVPVKSAWPSDQSISPLPQEDRAAALEQPVPSGLEDTSAENGKNVDQVEEIALVTEISSEKPSAIFGDKSLPSVLQEPVVDRSPAFGATSRNGGVEGTISGEGEKKTAVEIGDGNSEIEKDSKGTLHVEKVDGGRSVEPASGDGNVVGAGLKTDENEQDQRLDGQDSSDDKQGQINEDETIFVQEESRTINEVETNNETSGLGVETFAVSAGTGGEDKMEEKGKPTPELNSLVIPTTLPSDASLLGQQGPVVVQEDAYKEPSTLEEKVESHSPSKDILPLETDRDSQASLIAPVSIEDRASEEEPAAPTQSKGTDEEHTAESSMPGFPILSNGVMLDVNVPVVDYNELSLQDMIRSTQQCMYQPAEFFVAWQGVLTIVYLGLPPPLEKLKKQLDSRFPSFVKENPGSKWPKTSLACLKDNQRLSREQLATLREICSKVSFQLAFSDNILVDQLSVVLYENCCLEKTILKTDIPLQSPVDTSSPTFEQRKSVREVVDEFAAKNLHKYWFHVSKDGNRSTHYKQLKVGSTIVHYLKDRVPDSLAVFQRLVDAAMPGMYEWFPKESLHITLRAIV